MRQMEGSWASDVLLENSKRRLDRLGYFKEVQYETVPVPGEVDKIDVNFTVEEEFSGSIAGSLGYGAYGFSLGANYSESNAFGTGNRISIGINSSDYQTNLQFNFFDPYFTIDGIGLGMEHITLRLIILHLMHQLIVQIQLDCHQILFFQLMKFNN